MPVGWQESFKYMIGTREGRARMDNLATVILTRYKTLRLPSLPVQKGYASTCLLYTSDAADDM
eukprot:2285091-Rhodomonas_salina.1